MKKILFVALLSWRVFYAHGQTTRNDTSLKSLAKFDIGLHEAGFSYEARLGNKITLDVAAGAGGGYYVSEVNVDYHSNLQHPVFHLTATPRFYYNRTQRIREGKKYNSNSGNYIGLRLKYATSALGADNTFSPAGLINLHWGMQRSIGNRWILNAHAGAGYAQDLNSTFGGIYPAFELKFSYIFTRLQP